MDSRLFIKVCQTNRDLANENLKFQPILDEEKTKLSGLYSKLQAAESAYEEAKNRYDSMKGTFLTTFTTKTNFIIETSESYTLDSASAVLQASAADADMNSEDLALSFVNGEMTIEEFKKKFVNERTDAHKLKLKSEKILQQASNQQSAYSGTQISSGAPPTYQHYR